MKKRLNSTAKRLLSVFLVMACIFVNCTIAFAYDMPTTEDGEMQEYTDLIPIEETDISRQEAIQTLGLTEEEAKGVELYATNTEVITSGSYYNSGYFQFTGHNGGAYRTMKGNELKYSVCWKPLYDDSPIFECFLYPYGERYIDHGWLSTATLNTGGENNEYKLYVSDWKSITYGLDYRLTYSCINEYGNETRCEIRVIIAVV